MQGYEHLLVIAQIGTGGSYMLQAFMYAFATIWTYQLRIPARVEQFDEQGMPLRRLPFVQSIGEGLAFVAKYSAALLLPAVVWPAVAAAAGLGRPKKSLLLPAMAASTLKRARRSAAQAA